MQTFKFFTYLFFVSLCTLVKLLLYKSFVVGNENINIDNIHAKFYGPGLRPDEISLPVRYFFIEFHDANGERVHQTFEKRLKVDIDGDTHDGLNCRIWVQTLDLRDGTYLGRYRVYQTCINVIINVMIDYKHVSGSPFKIKGSVYPESCNCPLDSVDEWTEVAQCPEPSGQIRNDLSQFERVDMNEVLENTVNRLHQPESRSFCNYVVLDNEVYKRCYGKHVGFSMFMENILLSLTRLLVLPDLDFIVNLGDWPLSEKKASPKLPIFSWCGSEDTIDILMPTYDLTHSTLEMMAGVTLDVFSAQSSNEIPWEKKKPVAFWRGRDSRQERLDLIDLGKRHPDMFNVSLTNFFFFRDQEDRYGPKVSHESFFKFFDNKYQINIDGTVAAYRMPFLLSGSGVVFKQNSKYFEHFYNDLIPFVHYIPFERDLSDLVEKINWAMNHDAEAKNISRNAQSFAREHLLPVHVYCYHVLLFKEWSKMVVSEVRVRDNMEKVANKDSSRRFGSCRCHRKSFHDEF